MSNRAFVVFLLLLPCHLIINSATLMKRDDILWKGIIEDIFDDFLLFFFKEEASLFDIDRGFEFLDKELEQIFPGAEDASAPKFVDKLVKVFTKNNTEECPPVPFGRGCWCI